MTRGDRPADEDLPCRPVTRVWGYPDPLSVAELGCDRGELDVATEWTNEDASQKNDP
ncbi:hypothetical protein [Rubidibacter lacunae]|uniref:hypothetical protein n=1 Tax=Rubidibacter lacunae TaxID=582514 RepID=UPI00041884EF|nr:hypothetical protein [Rubidibacter lacunae]